MGLDGFATCLDPLRASGLKVICGIRRDIDHQRLAPVAAVFSHERHGRPALRPEWNVHGIDAL
jgi:hypothetical protein